MISVPTPAIDVEIAGRTVRVSNPDKVYFPARGETKLDLVHYYLAVSDGALRGVFERPTVLKRFPDGALGEPFFQKRVPPKRPDWLETVLVTFPERPLGRRAVPGRRRPPGVGGQPRVPRPQSVAGAPGRRRPPRRAPGRPRPAAGRPLRRRSATSPGSSTRSSTAHGSSASRSSRVPEASTSTCASSRGGTSPRSGAAALALGRAVEREVPTLATTKWWKEERGDASSSTTTRTRATARSRRPTPCGTTPKAASRARSSGTSSPTSTPPT